MLVFQLEAKEFAALLSYLNLHKILVSQDKGVDIHECPLLKSPSTLDTASYHLQVSDIWHLRATKTRNLNITQQEQEKKECLRFKHIFRFYSIPICSANL